MKSIRRGSWVLRTVAAIAALAAVPSAHARSGLGDGGGGDMAAGVFSVLLSSPTILLGASTGGVIDRKQALALAALEDVAVYHETGSLAGVLPAAISSLQQLKGMTEAEAIEHITEAAEAEVHGEAAGLSDPTESTADKIKQNRLNAGRVAQLCEDELRRLTTEDALQTAVVMAQKNGLIPKKTAASLISQVRDHAEVVRAALSFACNAVAQSGSSTSVTFLSLYLDDLKAISLDRSTIQENSR